MLCLKPPLMGKGRRITSHAPHFGSDEVPVFFSQSLAPEKIYPRLLPTIPGEEGERRERGRKREREREREVEG